ncbi:MAG: inositol monophosphatase [Verrucomicrobiae bacterium]|nr:inositol monophosphatase [Verrucomicrobiae bacterium]
MNKSETRRALAAAVRAARAAGKLMRANLRAAKTINCATAHDIKLELDVRCQKLIETSLSRSFPQIALLGEEGVAGAAEAARRWVVDPIDGTVNFAYGIPHACVSIALQARTAKLGARKNQAAKLQPASAGPEYETILGVVYDPFTDELWTAIRGQVARLNGRPIHVSNRRRMGDAIVSLGFAKTRESLEKSLPLFNALVRRVRKVRIMGSAALALTYVATGRFDAYLERGINLWDIAAGGLIVECAGGRFWREPIAGEHRFRMIASNGRLHRSVPVPK